jgi:hypothetical protein
MVAVRATTGVAEADGKVEAKLRAIPNVGPVIASDLIRLGITRLEDLAGRDPDDMYDALCALYGRRHDPCMRDVFAAVVAYANGEEARPWWAFTPARKARDEQSTRASKMGTSGRAG